MAKKAFISPVFNGQQFFTNDGVPLSGGKIFSYVAGSSSVQQNTYTGPNATVVNPNPMVMDSSGRYDPDIWLEVGLAYHLVVTRPDGVTVLIDVDNVVGVQPVAPGGGVATAVWTPSLGLVTYLNGSSFLLNDNEVQNFKVGNRIRASQNGGYVYGTVTAVNFASPNTMVTVSMDNALLSPNIDSVSYSSVVGPAVDAGQVSYSEVLAYSIPGTVGNKLRQLLSNNYAAQIAAFTKVWTTAGGGTAVTGSQNFDAPGTNSFTVPAGVSQLIVNSQGGGGGGGGTGRGTGGEHTGCGSGGGSGYFSHQTVSVTPGEVLTVVVGSGGAAGGAHYSRDPIGAGNGTDGGLSGVSRGNTLIAQANGGSQGVGGHEDTVVPGGSGYQAGGDGQPTYGNDVHLIGGVGGASSFSNTQATGGDSYGTPGGTGGVGGGGGGGGASEHDPQDGGSNGGAGGPGYVHLMWGSSGVAGYTIQPNPATTDYTVTSSWNVKFHATSGDSPTLAVNSLPALALKQYNAAGSKVGAAVVGGQVSQVIYDGADLVVLDSLNNGGSVPSDGGSSGGVAGSSYGMQVFTSNGTFQPSSGVTSVRVTVVGGGGGGGPQNYSGSNEGGFTTTDGTKGGNGGCGIAPVAVSEGTQYPVVVGGGGGIGAPGGNSSFGGGIVTATGGGGGVYAPGSPGANGTSNGGYGLIGTYYASGSERGTGGVSQNSGTSGIVVVEWMGGTTVLSGGSGTGSPPPAPTPAPAPAGGGGSGGGGGGQLENQE